MIALQDTNVVFVGVYSTDYCFGPLQLATMDGLDLVSGNSTQPEAEWKGMAFFPVKACRI